MKTSTKLLLTFFLFLLLAITAVMGVTRFRLKTTLHGNGIKISEKRMLKNFTGIDVSGGANIILTQTTNYIFEIKGDQNLMDQVSTEIIDSILVVKLPDSHNHAKFELLISAPQYQSLKIANGSIIKSNGPLSGTALLVDMTTGSLGTLDINYANIDCSASTGSVLTFKGSAGKGIFNASTGSIINASDLLLKECSVDGSTGVQMEMNVSENMDIQLSTGSSLKYKGSPRIRMLKNSTGASVEQIN